jgi:hypothetical protein
MRGKGTHRATCLDGIPFDFQCDLSNKLMVNIRCENMGNVVKNRDAFVLVGYWAKWQSVSSKDVSTTDSKQCMTQQPR